MEVKGKFIYLRSIEEEDMESIYMSCQDEEFLYMTGTRKTFTLDEIIKSYKQFSKDPTRYDFAICLVDTDEIIGDLSIVDIDQDNKKAGFRISLHSKNTLNKGYGTEATQLALKFTFEELKLNRLELEVFSHNVRGIKAYEKAGFKKEGTLRQSLYMNNKYSDEVLMGMLQEDYYK
ncbi:GNAT family N-acetyltransferase [Lysinibacillus sp. 2017]|uniref:GNAT family N-acetyltransferase n=1 Tax=unclassified Lysinibacillus TaxID=2636778 RepID=UPI000D529989|nr:MULTISPECIES: GNAT family protein [unclassified Lysinibacillus]AWE07286.1 GNAT family N-acetyltransferase [Lysinibacillus sp. 2017]TGN30807.1 N-acetyltransferase [Lysinibacillus sp. S2017]